MLFIGGLMSDFGSVGGDVWSVPLSGGEPKNLTPRRQGQLHQPDRHHRRRDGRSDRRRRHRPGQHQYGRRLYRNQPFRGLGQCVVER
ncbi:MAG: hypothetical protein WDN06_11005 [Asticcacaulis sp.]